MENLPQKPDDFEEVHCPNCGYNITISFNSLRTAIFNSAQKEYLERKKRLEQGIPGWVKDKIKLHVERYEQGKETTCFDMRCKGCIGRESKLKFIAYHTLKGETKMADGRPVLIVHPNPKEVNRTTL